MPGRALTVLLAAAVAVTFVVIAVFSPADRHGPQVALVTAAVWVAATGGRWLWRRVAGSDATLGPPSIDALSMFLLASSAVYTVLALEAADVTLTPSADQADLVPGLSIDLRAYYLAVQAGVVATVALWGQGPGRALVTALAVHAVFVSPLYEPAIQADTGTPLLLGSVLVMGAFALTEPGRAPFRLTPVGPPLAAFLIAGLIVTITASYVGQSLFLAGKIGSFVVFALLVANLVRERWHFWLLWCALVLPAAGMAVVELYKLVDIAANLGPEFAVRYRFHFIGLIGANTIGLALAIAMVLIVGALFWVRDVRARLAIAALLVPVVPALLSLRSTSAAVALIAAVGALVAVVALDAGARRWVTERVTPVTAGAAALAVVAVALLLIVPNPYSDEWRNEISDPTTGRGLRENVWPRAMEDYLSHPVTGIGLTDRRFETRTGELDEFPFREVTSLAERRLLLGGHGFHWALFIWGHPHNIVLLVAETMGTVGLVTLLWLLAALGFLTFDVVRRPLDDARWVGALALAGVAAGLAWSLFALGLNVAYLPPHTWLLIGVAGAAYCLAYRRVEDEPLPVWRAPRVDVLRPALPALTTGVIALTFLGLVARPAVAGALESEAQEYRLVGRRSEAIDNLKLARRLDPLHTGYADALSQILFRSAQTPDALKVLERLVELDPRDAANHASLAWVRFYAGDVEGALMAFERSVELDPWNALSSNNIMGLGLAQLAAGERDAAIETITTAVLYDPVGAARDEAWVPFGSQRAIDPGYTASSGAGRRAVILAERLRIGPVEGVPSPGSFAGSQTVLFSDVRNAAYDRYRTELRTDPERAAGMLSALARAHLTAGINEPALALLLELVELAPDESYAHYDLGRAYAAVGHRVAAAQAFERVVDLAAGTVEYDLYEPFARYRLGQLQLSEGDAEGALESFRGALDTYRWPYFPEAYVGLAEAAELAGRPDEARRTLDDLSYLLERWSPGTTVAR